MRTIWQAHYTSHPRLHSQTASTMQHLQLRDGRALCSIPVILGHNAYVYQTTWGEAQGGVPCPDCLQIMLSNHNVVVS